MDNNIRGGGHTTVMEKSVVSERKILIVSALICIIILLMGLAFLPSVRRGSMDVPAAARGIGDDALDALWRCVEQTETDGFNAKLTGTVKAHVIAVPYTLNVRGQRTVAGNDFTSVKESVSAMVKLGIKTERKGGEYYVARGEYDKNTGGFIYPESENVERDKFDGAYGYPASLLRYDIDGNILSAERIGENVYRYELDIAAAERCKAEVCSLVNCKTPPEYKSIELTLFTDGERAVKISAVEKFRVDKFGGINCVAEYSEEVY